MPITLLYIKHDRAKEREVIFDRHVWDMQELLRKVEQGGFDIDIVERCSWQMISRYKEAVGDIDALENLWQDYEVVSRCGELLKIEK